MFEFIARRIADTIPVLIISAIVIFASIRLIPGDTALILAGPEATPETITAIRRDLGLDQPIWAQFWIWTTHMVRADLGRSVLSNQPVAQVIGSRIPATIELTIAASVVAVLVAFPMGIIAAVRHRSAIDVVISSITGLLIAIPNFWFGILAIIVFALILGWLPPGERMEFIRDPLLALKFLCLPAITLALPSIVVLSRQVRSSMLEVLHEDYIRTARAKGLSAGSIISGHVLRNALVPVVTILGLQFGRLLGGSVIVESVFGWPGMGRLIVDSIGTRDYAVVQATLLMLVFAYIVINLVIDLAYGALDPRIRLTRANA